jgi:hypothetical protein
MDDYKHCTYACIYIYIHTYIYTVPFSVWSMVFMWSALVKWRVFNKNKVKWYISPCNVMFTWSLALWHDLRTCCGHYRLHRTSSLDFIMNQMNPVYIFTSNSFKIRLNIIFQSTLMCTNLTFHFRFTHQNFVHISCLFNSLLSVLLTKYTVSIYVLTWDEWESQTNKKVNCKIHSVLLRIRVHTFSLLFETVLLFPGLQEETLQQFASLVTVSNICRRLVIKSRCR